MIYDMHLIDGVNVPLPSKKRIPVDSWTFLSPPFA